MLTLFSSLSFTNRQWNDVVFEDRNKNYGAYYIRTHYNENLARALFFSSLLFVVPFAGTLLLKSSPITKSDLPPVVDTAIFRVYKVEPRLPKTIPTPPEAHQQVVTPPANDHLLQRIVDDHTPIEPSLTPTETQTVTATTTTEGGTGTTVAPSALAPDTAIRQTWGLDVMPQFPGGEKAMNNYIINNARLNSVWRENGSEGKIFFQFVVGRDGAVTDVSVISDRIGYGVGDDNKALFLNMPKWKPGMQNGHNVRVMLRLPLTLKKY